jgi:hypothetical protein
MFDLSRKKSKEQDLNVRPPASLFLEGATGRKEITISVILSKNHNG